MGILHDSYFCRGNVISPYQWSSYIRPYTETKCNGMEFPLGHLRQFDMDSPRFERMPQIVRAKVSEYTQSISIILYVIHHYSEKNKKRVIDGYIITNTEHQLLYQNNCGKYYGFVWDYMRKAVNQITVKEN